jgi:hypothetical protein
MTLLLKYPVHAAMMRPVTKPRNTLADFMKADPKISQMMMTAKHEKPRPRYCAEPHGCALGPEPQTRV